MMCNIPVVATGATLFGVGIVALIKIRRLLELHHLFYGAILGVLACVFHWPIWTMIVALILLLDDDVQHVAEALGIVPRMADFTPIHKIGSWIIARFLSH